MHVHLRLAPRPRRVGRCAACRKHEHGEVEDDRQRMVVRGIEKGLKGKLDKWTRGFIKARQLAVKWMLNY
ncbi:hypothetical protein BS78_03G206000 [Paspalum vaginatum]|nr:hypothetical protein BS78_03G206000 [Paspalum vaginatum]